MDNKDILLIGAAIAIILLLKNKKGSQGQKAELQDTSRLFIDKMVGDGFQTQIVSPNPISAEVIPGTKTGRTVKVKITATANDDMVKNFSAIKGIPFLF